MAEQNTIETAADLAVKASGKPEILVAADTREFLILPEGMRSENISQPHRADVLMPRLVEQNVTLQTVDSLIAYVNRFKNHDTVLFADIRNSRVLSIIDYHKMPGANIPDKPSVPTEGPSSDFDAHARLGRHAAVLNLPFSEEWTAWMGISGKLMSHVEFATFLEENAIDILPLPKLADANGEVIEDAPTTMLELCRELQIKGGYGANSSVRNGDYTNVEMQKGDDVSTKRNVTLPASFNLMYPVYFGERAVPITAFLRRDTSSGSLRLGIKLNRAENVRQDEFHRIVAGIQTEVELTTLYGVAS